MTTKTTKTAAKQQSLAAYVAANAVKSPNVFTLHGDAATGRVLNECDTANREKTWPHVGKLIASMRNFNNMNEAERWIELTTAITFFADKDSPRLATTTDGGQRIAAMVLAFGDQADWEWLGMRYAAFRTKDKDGNVVVDLAKMKRVLKCEPLEARRPTEECPRFILSLDTDKHYFNVADQDQKKRTGADTLTTTTDIGNALANVEMPPKLAQVVLRRVYLRCYRTLTKEGKPSTSSFGSVKTGGNINASRYPGYYAVIGDAMLKAWKLYNRLVDEFTKADNACDVANLAIVGVDNILTVMTLAELSKTPGTWIDDTSHTVTHVEETTGYTSLLYWDEETIRSGLKGLLVAHLDRHSNTGWLFMECNRKGRRIMLAERNAALCDIFGFGSYEVPDSQPWNIVFCQAALGDDVVRKLTQAGEFPSCEQLWGLRWYGPDSTGWRVVDHDKMELAATGKVKTKRPRKSKTAK